MSKNTEQLNISVPKDMKDWLDKPENKKRYSASKIFQDNINEIRYGKPKKVAPMTYLVIIMGMAFGVGCLSAAATMTFSFLFNTTLMLLGAVIILAALVTMVKETRLRDISHKA